MPKTTIFEPTASVSFDYAPIKPNILKNIKTKMPDNSVVLPVVLSYTGVRPYDIDGKEVLVLRREEQVFSKSYLQTLRFVTNTRGHPKVKSDSSFRYVWLDIEGRGEIDDLGFVRLPPEEYSVGHTGEEVWKENIDGVNMPVGLTCIKNAACLESILKGLVQTSLGYFGLKVPPPEEDMVDGFGIWEGPNGPQRYHLEQVLDLEDPRLQPEYILEKGLAGSLEEAENLRRRVGVNHLAVAIPRGRGGPNVRIQLDAKKECFVDMGSSDISEDIKLGVSSTVSIGEPFIDIDNPTRDSKNELAPKLSLMKYNISHTLPRLTSILDEIGTSSMPHREVDMPADILEVLKMAEDAIVKTFEALKAQLQEKQADLDVTKEELAEKEVDKEAFEQEKAQMTDSLKSLQSDFDRVQAECDQALAELKPIQKNQLLEKIMNTLKLGGFDVSKAASFDSIEDAQRAVVLEKVPSLKSKKVSPDYIAGRYQAIVDSSSKSSEESDFFALHRKHALDENFENFPDAGQVELEKIRKKCG